MKWLSVSAAAGCLSLPLAGCSLVHGGGLETIDDANAGDVESSSWGAVFLSPQAQYVEPIGPNASGELLTFDERGATYHRSTDPAQNNRIMWCGEAMVFVDESSDYFVSAAGMQEVEHEKPYEQVTASCDGVGPSFVGLYNEGFADDGYRMYVDTSSPGGFDRQQVRGAFLIAGADGSDLYGTGYLAVGDPDYTDSSTDHNEQGQHFSRLTGRKGDHAHAPYVTTYQSHGATEKLTPGPEERMYSISCREDVAGVTDRLVLDSWAKADGEYRSVPLTDAEGADLPPIDAQACVMLHTGSLVDEDALVWFSGDGQAWETRLPGGETRTLYSLNRDWRSAVSTRLDTTADVLAVLAADGADEDEFSVQFRDLRTGAHLHTVDLPQLSEYSIGQRGIEGFNVRPDIAEKLAQLKSSD